jgi:hypothetical protein
VGIYDRNDPPVTAAEPNEKKRKKNRNKRHKETAQALIE